MGLLLLTFFILGEVKKKAKRKTQMSSIRLAAATEGAGKTKTFGRAAGKKSRIRFGGRQFTDQSGQPTAPIAVGRAGVVPRSHAALSFDQIKANYRQENPPGSRTLGDFLFSTCTWRHIRAPSPIGAKTNFEYRVEKSSKMKKAQVIPLSKKKEAQILEDSALGPKGRFYRMFDLISLSILFSQKKDKTQMATHQATIVLKRKHDRSA
jgi:hypothetical protein